MKIGGELGYRLLRRLKPGRHFQGGVEACASYVPKIKGIVGDAGWQHLQNKTVLDFGCGGGRCSVEMAQNGAKRVIGLDIRPEVLERARQAACAAGVRDTCKFTETIDQPVDVVVSVDAFERFEDPAGALTAMDRLLKDDGYVVMSFGPTCYHPRGGHIVSVFP